MGAATNAAWDAAALTLDAAAVLLPFVPVVGAGLTKGARFSDDATALVDLAKEAKRTGGVSPDDANTLLGMRLSVLDPLPSCPLSLSGVAAASDST